MKPLTEKDIQWLQSLDAALADAVLHARGYTDGEIADIFERYL